MLDLSRSDKWELSLISLFLKQLKPFDRFIFLIVNGPATSSADKGRQDYTLRHVPRYIFPVFVLLSKHFLLITVQKQLMRSNRLLV